MNFDIRLNTDFNDNLKVLKLERKLGDTAGYNLIKLWMWTAKNKPNGVLIGLTEDDIELAAQWKGAFGEFAKALTEYGFIERTEYGFIIHDWKEHNPYAAADEERANKGRFAKLKQENPAMWKILSKQGINALTVEEYNKYKACYPTGKPKSNPEQKQGNPGVTQGSPQGEPSPISYKPINQDQNISSSARARARDEKPQQETAAVAPKEELQLQRQETLPLENQESKYTLEEFMQLWNRFANNNDLEGVEKANDDRRKKFNDRQNAFKHVRPSPYTEKFWKAILYNAKYWNNGAYMGNNRWNEKRGGDPAYRLKFDRLIRDDQIIEKLIHARLNGTETERL